MHRVGAERRLVANMVADIVGYSRLMGVDEAGTLRHLKALRREVIDPSIAAAHGRIVKTMRNGVLVEVPSLLRAVACAVRIQRAMLGRAHLAYVCGASWIRCGLIAVHRSILVVGHPMFETGFLVMFGIGAVIPIFGIIYVLRA